MAYTAKQKATILERFDKLRESGKTAHQAADQAGASYLTILRWRKAAGKPIQAVRSKATPAYVASDLPPARLTVLTPDGFRIEADDPKDIIAVLTAIKP
jgi:DNA-binding GntR family transcriptional regulator